MDVVEEKELAGNKVSGNDGDVRCFRGGEIGVHHELMNDDDHVNGMIERGGVIWLG